MRNRFDRLGIVPFMIAGVGLFLLGLLATNHIVNNFWPFDVARLDLVRATALDEVDATAILGAANDQILMAFLASMVVAATGLVMPLVYFANVRFREADQSPAFLIILRQAMWVGLWLAFCLWLQMNRSLGIAVAGLVAAVLGTFEVLLQVRDRASSIE